MKKNQPDLVLCDFRLDDMTGAELLAKIKEMHPAAPVIIITGYSDVKDAVEVMKLGAYDYVTKPLFPDEILLTIKKALSEEPKEHSASWQSTWSHQPMELQPVHAKDKRQLSTNNISLAIARSLPTS